MAHFISKRQALITKLEFLNFKRRGIYEAFELFSNEKDRIDEEISITLDAINSLDDTCLPVNEDDIRPLFDRLSKECLRISEILDSLKKEDTWPTDN